MDFFIEAEKCKNSFLYFLENYVKVQNPFKGLVKFEFYKFHKELYELYEKERFVSTIKYRQGGFSTLTALYGLWKCMFFQNQRFLFLSKTDREAVCLNEVVRTVIDAFPEEFKFIANRMNGHTIEFILSNSSMLFHTNKSARSKSCTHLIIDEAAFFLDMDSHWKAMYPIISTGGKCFVVSTPNAADGWFYELCRDAEAKKNDFIIYKPNYLDHPLYQDIEFREQTRKNLGERGWEQEVLCNFLPRKPITVDAICYTNEELISMLKTKLPNDIKLIDTIELRLNFSSTNLFGW